MKPLQLAVKLTRENYSDKSLYVPMLSDFQFDPEQLKNATVTKGDVTRNALEEYRNTVLPHYQSTWPSSLRHFGYGHSLDDVVHKNAVPVALRDTLAAAFFADYPKGAIWYVRFGNKYLYKSWDIDASTARELKIKSGWRGAHSYSGLDIASLPYHSLVWFSTIFFPYVLFSVRVPFTGFLLFVADPIPKYEGWGDGMTLSSMIADELLHVYNDDHGCHIDERYVYPANQVCPGNIEPLLEWWLSAMSRRIDLIHKTNDPVTATITALTLNRILVEGTLLNTSFNHFVRKSTFLSSMDKWASLIARARGLKQREETNVWLELMSRTFIRTRLGRFATSLPLPLGAELARFAAFALDHVSFERLSPKLLRAYRNSAHGYGIRDWKLLLSHCSPIDNNLPDLATLFTMYLVSSRTLDPLQHIRTE